MEITREQLSQIIPKNPYIDQWCNALNQLLPDYGINTPQRVAAFLAQCAHESGNFVFLKENLNYRAVTLRKLFSKYFPNDQLAEQYANRPNKAEAIANRIYANRMGNGPEESGDGFRYCGRGLFQLPGRNNYEAFADSIESTPEEVSAYLETFEGAVQSACWFWETNNLNQFADADDIKTMTRRINGGFIGLGDREKHYEHAKHVFGGH